MSQVAKHLFAFVIAIVITAVSVSETVAVPTAQSEAVPAALAA